MGSWLSKNGRNGGIPYRSISRRHPPHPWRVCSTGCSSWKPGRQRTRPQDLSHRNAEGRHTFLVLAAGLSAANGRDRTSTDGGADVEDVARGIEPKGECIRVVSCSLRTVSDAPAIEGQGDREAKGRRTYESSVLRGEISKVAFKGKVGSGSLKV